MPRLLAITFIALATSATLAAPPTEAEIRQWILDLEDPKFKVRTIASGKLKEAGDLAIPYLSKSVLDGSPETIDRVMKLLEEFAVSKDNFVQEASLKVVRDLAKGDSPVATSATQILNKRRHDLIRLMEEGGAVIQQSDDGVRSVFFDKVSVADMPRFLKFMAEFPETEYFSASTKAFDDQCAMQLAKLSNLREVNLFESAIGDEGLKSIARLKKLNWLPMGKTNVTDAGLKHLSGLKNLDYIGVRGNAITDKGVRELKCHANLIGLNLGETQISDAAISELKELPNLKRLYLNGTKISDKALDGLAKFKDLEDTWLLKTNTTFEGRTKLKEALPSLRIVDEEKDYP